MSGKARGKRPGFAADPNVDRLTAMVLALAGEVSVLRERVDTLERLLERSGSLTRAEIEAYRPDAAAAEERERWRAAFLDRVLWIVRAGEAEAVAGETPESYQAVVDALAAGPQLER